MQFKTFRFKVLTNHRDIAFCVDALKFELYENLKRTDVRNLSFILSLHRFVLELCNVKPFCTRFFDAQIVLQSLFNNLTL